MTQSKDCGDNGAVDEDRIREVRAFSRFYTAVIGLLDEGLLRSPYSLTEARVIFELAQADATEVVDLRRRLGVDAGYLSRILARFDTDGLIHRERSGGDARRQVIRLAQAGRDVYSMLDSRSAAQVRGLLAGLTDYDQGQLVEAMGTVRELLGHVVPGGRRDAPAGPSAARGTAEASDRTVALRPLRPGDLGWVVARHGVLYAREYGWDQSFEGLVARIVADYADHRDADRDNAWIAELAGEPVGCVFCVHGDDERTAKLRLLLVEPSARGHGVGTRLVDECVAFARAAGYTRLTLWTNDVLVAARRIYERAGFDLVEEERHRSFGHELVGQYWRLDL